MEGQPFRPPFPKPGLEYFDSYGWDFTFESRNPQELERLKKLLGR